MNWKPQKSNIVLLVFVYYRFLSTFFLENKKYKKPDGSDCMRNSMLEEAHAFPKSLFICPKNFYGFNTFFYVLFHLGNTSLQCAKNLTSIKSHE